MKKIFEHVNHKKPVTRREFLAAGALDLVAVSLVPGALSQLLLPKTLRAEGCGAPGMAPGLLPFLVFDCAGGAALSGNFVVGKQGGSLDFLASYNQMGVAVNPSAGEPIDTQFGLPLYTNLSQIRAGLVAATTATNLKMASICNASTDDTAVNLLSPLGLVVRAGASGSRVQNPIGTTSSNTGGNSAGPSITSGMKPLRVNDATSVINALSFGPGLSGLTVNQREAIAKALVRMSQSQKEKFLALDLGAQFTSLAECGYIKNIQYADSTVVAAEVDPRLDPDAQAVYGIAPTSTGGITRTASVVYNVLKGNTGPGVITFGGCDYHDGTQTTGDTKDLEIGTEIGRAVELARRLNKPLFFVIISDGSVYSDPDTRLWRGDASSKGLAVMGYFNPNAIPSQRATQLGHYRDAQGVERNTFVGNDPKRTAYTLFLNYLAASGKLSEFHQYVPRNEFELSFIDPHIIFG